MSEQTSATATTRDLMARLERHYIPAGRPMPGGVFLPEVGWNATGGTSRADALYVGFTSASGRILIGHEVKASRSDWLTELRKPGKADGWADQVEANVVSREMGVQPIVNKVTMGEADAGIVFVTDLPADLRGATLIEIPDAANTLVAFSIAPVTRGMNQAGADAFITFMTTGAGKDVLTDKGYLAPTP